MDLLTAIWRSERIEINSETSESAINTVVTLHPYRSEYKSRCPSRTDTLAQRIIAHFLPVFASGSCPSIKLEDNESETDLNTYFKNNIIDSTTSEINVEISELVTQKIHVKHMKCNKDIRPRGQNYNWLFICAIQW